MEETQMLGLAKHKSGSFLQHAHDILGGPNRTSLFITLFKKAVFKTVSGEGS